MALGGIADRFGAATSSAFTIVPLSYGVPRIWKLSAAAPQALLSHSKSDCNPPAATTTVLAGILTCSPLDANGRTTESGRP